MKFFIDILYHGKKFVDLKFTSFYKHKRAKLVNKIIDINFERTSSWWLSEAELFLVKIVFGALVELTSVVIFVDEFWFKVITVGKLDPLAVLFAVIINTANVLFVELVPLLSFVTVWLVIVLFWVCRDTTKRHKRKNMCFNIVGCIEYLNLNKNWKYKINIYTKY